MFNVIIKMTKCTYRWEWKNDDGSNRKIEISTFQSKDVAREKALAYFPNDQNAIDYIMATEPQQKVCVICRPGDKRYALYVDQATKGMRYM